MGGCARPRARFDHVELVGVQMLFLAGLQRPAWHPAGRLCYRGVERYFSLLAKGLWSG
jgi:hypothetical protein